MDCWKTVEALENAGQLTFEIKNKKLKIIDEARFRNDTVQKLIWNATFAEDESVKKLAQWVIWEASLQLDAISSSIQDFYLARAKDKWQNLTVPAINLRGLTYDIACTIFKVLNRLNAQACIFEIAKTEMEYTKQPPAEYASCILAAAMHEYYRGPIFLQGDHFQINAKNFAKDRKKELDNLKHLITESVEAGFFNFDLDTSTLVDLSQAEICDQQQPNFTNAAELAKFIRANEPKGVTIAIGGEIGENGEANSTEEELSCFVEGFNSALNLDTNIKPVGLSKISVQTGAIHGGVVLANGSIAKVKLDFETLEKLGKLAREQFDLGGVVQHGASTLTENAFDNFPKRETLEVHLATAFQNIIYETTAFPKILRENIYKWLKQNCAQEAPEGLTDEQFYYRTRKKGFGPFKKELWSLSDNTKTALMSELARTFDMMFRKLGVENSKELVEKLVKPVPVHHEYPL
ncbi:MAG: class II fructose-bisphosphate aldolase [Pseudomonadota bacterium]